MNTFTIRDIENLCGIKAHTLRIWEQRYDFFSPKRKAGNHRQYDNEDLKNLLRISFLYHNGYKISKIAKLGEEGISDLILQATQTGYSHDMFINQMAEAAIDFDQNRFDGIMSSAIQHHGLEKFMFTIAYPLLRKMGMLWVTGHVIPAQEHLTCSLIIHRLLLKLDELAAVEPNKENQMLVFSPKGEMHEIPILFMYYMMKKNNVSAVYLGKNIVPEDLVYYCKHKQVTHLYFHVITNLMRCSLDQYITKLTVLFPDKIIVCSGTLVGSLANKHPNVRILASEKEMEVFAQGH